MARLKGCWSEYNCWMFHVWVVLRTFLCCLGSPGWYEPGFYDHILGMERLLLMVFGFVVFLQVNFWVVGSFKLSGLLFSSCLCELFRVVIGRFCELTFVMILLTRLYVSCWFFDIIGVCLLNMLQGFFLCILNFRNRTSRCLDAFGFSRVGISLNGGKACYFHQVVNSG